MTCCFLSSLKTFAMPTEATKLRAGVNVPGEFYMAGFELTLHGRFWVTAEAETEAYRLMVNSRGSGGSPRGGR